jgi:hypothetical protein
MKKITSKIIKDLKKLLDKRPEKVCRCRCNTNVVGGFHATTKGIYCNSCGGKR